MSTSQNDNGINPEDLPQSEVFKQKEVFQHPQPQDFGKPLPPKEADKAGTEETSGKEQQKTSKDEGLNEQRSSGDAGAFEGFEDQRE